MFIKKDLKLKTNIDLTPMIDVVMLLVMFFLATSTFSQMGEIKINLPLSTSSTVSEKENFVITLTKEGQIYWNNQLIEKRELKTLIEQAVVNEKDKIFVIKGDKNTSYQNLIEIMDIARLSGAYNIALDVKQNE